MTLSTSPAPPRGGVLRGRSLLTAESLQQRAARAATGFASLGIAAGDTVAILMRNDHPFFEVSFAAAMLGAAPVPINWHGTPDEVSYVLRDCRAKVLVAHADLIAPLRATLPDDLLIFGVDTPADVAAAYDLDAAATLLPPGVVAWHTWQDTFEPWCSSQSPEPLSMIYTSGTTGRPKGVRRLQPISMDPADQQAYATDLARVMGLGPGMRTVVSGPLYHSAPNVYALNSLRMGGYLVLQPRFDAEGLLQLIQEHAITHLHMVPTMFVRILKLPAATRARFDVTSLRHVVHAGAPCPQHVKRAMIEWWGPIVHEYYGGTESGAVVGCDTVEWLEHPGTVGRPLATAAVRIVADDGSQAPPGQPGEVFMRASAFPDFTYEGRSEDRIAVERDGLISCGDVGYLDPDGYLYLCDRKRDVVISGGVNIYPAEVEACLLNLPGVRDCAVFGIPDDEYGEALAAAVELSEGVEVSSVDIQDHVRRHLAGFKVPRLVTFHDRLPREDTGKIFKRKLRAPYWEATGRAI